MDMPSSRRILYERLWPNLSPDNYEKTSEMDEHYNCVAWTVDVTTLRYWPATPGYFWPNEVQNDETIEAFIQFYETFGYEVCDDSNLEPGFEKIAIYVRNGMIMHVAKQLLSGYWTSKLGAGWEDIEHHTLNSIESPSYGRAVVFLRRLLRFAQ